MIRINLLPVRQNRKLEAARRDLLLSILGGVATFGLVMAGWAALNVRLAAQQSKNAELQEEVEKLQADVAKVDEIEKLQKELKQKLGVIDGLRARKQGPVHMLDDLALASPDNLRLTSLEQKGNDLKIAGVSVNNETISQYLRALDASPYFGDVFLQDIESTAPDPDFGAELKAFRLSAKVTLPSREAVAEPAGGAAAAAGTPDAGATPGAAPQEAAPQGAAAGEASPAPTGGAQ